MRFLRALALILFIPFSYASAETSSNCLQFSAPIELLICENSALNDIDDLLKVSLEGLRRKLSLSDAQNLIEQQDNWLKLRLDVCKVPVRDSLDDEERRKSATYCLIGSYQKRIDDLRREHPDFAKYQVIHPLCLMESMGVLIGQDNPEPTKVDVGRCNSENARFKIEKGRDKHKSYTSENGEDWLHYRSLGYLPNGRELVLATYNGGGTLTVSNLGAITRQASEGNRQIISTEILVAGADRCNGNIDDAEIRKDGLIVTWSVHAYSLLNELGILDDDTTSCAICCVSNIKTFQPHDNNNRNLISAYIDQDGFNSLKDGPDGDNCLASSLKKITITFPHNFSFAELQSVAQMHRSCRKIK